MDTHARLLQDYHCVEASPGVVGDAAAQAPDNAAEAPNVVTLLLPPLNLLATMQNSSEEEGNTNTRPTQARLTSQIMLNCDGTPFDGSGKRDQQLQYDTQSASPNAAQGSRPNFHTRGRHAGQRGRLPVLRILLILSLLQGCPLLIPSHTSLPIWLYVEGSAPSSIVGCGVCGTPRHREL